MNIAWHLFNHIINSHYLLQYCHIFLFFIFTYLYSTIYHCSSCLCCISICQKSEFYFSLSFESPFIIIIYTHILMYIQLHILLSFISLLARSWTVLHHLSFLLSWNAVFFSSIDLQDDGIFVYTGCELRNRLLSRWPFGLILLCYIISNSDVNH